ncbi:DUF350 domain-containing protein [Rhodovarius crocodyli]|uniref:DUF350 domain-containing protein n=2 Tax=Rhodovarius crocodyli TaxID=1979269 RepID=A0A437MDA2_9PROT|nr:DUF350 domain-containing protein [Rhodovarius crocodyli]
MGATTEHPGNVMLQHYFATLPVFLTWFPLGILMLAAFAAAYERITPWRELILIRNGNIAASASYSGALLGYALVLAAVMSAAQSRADLLLWALVGFVVQLLAFGVARLLLGAGLKARMEAGCGATGLFLGAVSVCAGLINAATMLG